MKFLKISAAIDWKNMQSDKQAHMMLRPEGSVIGAAVIGALREEGAANKIF